MPASVASSACRTRFAEPPAGTFGALKRAKIRATFFMQVPKEESHHAWVVKASGETHTLTVNPSDGRSPQKQGLSFAVKEPGKVTLAIDCTEEPPPAATRICFRWKLYASAQRRRRERTAAESWQVLAPFVRFRAPLTANGAATWQGRSNAAAGFLAATTNGTAHNLLPPAATPQGQPAAKLAKRKPPRRPGPAAARERRQRTPSASRTRRVLHE